ncbi:MAG: hypothetical protein ACM3SO_03105 [Betaproteobacteria bacterium]
MTRRILIAFVLLAAMAWAHAAQARHYAILSLVGDRLLVVTREMSTGSRLDRNTREYVRMPDNSLDRSMVVAIDEAIRRAQPGAATTLLAPKDPSLFAAADRRIEGSGNLAEILDAVRPMVAGTDATHLVLVTRQRHAAMLRLRDGMVGSGFLEGLGFYVDHGTFARSVDTNEAERGFIAPFTYVTVSLVDLANGRVLSEERVVGSAAYTTPSYNIGNAWLALTPQQKAERLGEVMKSESARVIPLLLARS